jgi:FkbM family methyltransferase
MRASDRTLQRVVLYGGGTLGRSVLRQLKGSSTEVVAIADDTPEKQGSVYHGVPILPLCDAAARFGDHLPFVVTVLNNALGFRDARARLLDAGVARAVSFFDLAWAHADRFLPHGWLVAPSAILTRRDDVSRAFACLTDEVSRRQFVGHLTMRLHLDFQALPVNSRAHYFPTDLFPGPLAPQAVFVDAGAYDGDTIQRFLDHQQSMFGSIHAFEPDEANLARMTARISALPTALRERIFVHPVAVGANVGRRRFSAEGGMGSAMRDTGADQVDVLPIGQVVGPGDHPTYVKLDIEGAEAEALAGCRGLAADIRTILAVSVYHRPCDLWELPILLASMCPEHRLFLRTEGEDGADLICYAMPPP